MTGGARVQRSRASVAPRDSPAVLHGLLGLHRPHVGRERRRVPQRQRHAPRGRVRHRDAPSASVPSRHVFARLDDSILVHRGDVPAAKLYAVVGEDVTRARAAASGGDRGSDDGDGRPILIGRAVGNDLAPRMEAAGSLCERVSQRRRLHGVGHPATEEMWRLAAIEGGRSGRRARAKRVGSRDHSAQTRGASNGERGDDALEAARAAPLTGIVCEGSLAPRRRRGSNSATSEGTASSHATSEIGTPPSRPRLLYRSRSGPSSRRRARTLWRRTTMETSTTSCTSDWRRVASTPPWRRCRAPDATTTRFSSRAPPTRDFSARRRETKRRAARRRRREGRVRRRRERRTPRRSTARPRAPRAPPSIDGAPTSAS